MEITTYISLIGFALWFWAGYSFGKRPRNKKQKPKSSEVTVKMSTEFHKKLGGHLQEFPLTPEECFKPNTESSVVKTDIETGHTPTSEHYKKAREIILNKDIEKQCPLCDGKGIREFPNCTPPIKEPCPGCEGEKKYTSMKDAFGMMTPKEAKEVSENMKEHNIFDKEIEDKTINFGINLNDSDDEDE